MTAKVLQFIPEAERKRCLEQQVIVPRRQPVEPPPPPPPALPFAAWVVIFTAGIVALVYGIVHGGLWLYDWLGRW